MEIPLKVPGFNSKVLSVRTAGFWSGSKLLVGGVPAEGKRGVYSVPNDSSEAVAIQLKSSFLDPVPKVVVGTETIELARPLAWYEYAWMAIPFVLVVSGGALGAGFGMAAIYSSARIFRSDRGTAAKYALTGLISAAAFLAFTVLVVVIQVLLRSQ